MKKIDEFKNKIKSIIRKNSNAPPPESNISKNLECYLLRLPREIQDMIASYLPASYLETDEEFAARRKFITQMPGQTSQGFNHQKHSRDLFSLDLTPIQKKKGILIKNKNRFGFKNLNVCKTVNKIEDQSHALFSNYHGTIDFSCSPSFSKIIIFNHDLKKDEYEKEYNDLLIFNTITTKKIYEEKIYADCIVAGLAVSDDAHFFALLTTNRANPYNDHKRIVLKNIQLNNYRSETLFYRDYFKEDLPFIALPTPWPKFFSFNKQGTKLIIVNWDGLTDEFFVTKQNEHQQKMKKTLAAYFLHHGICKKWPPNQ